MDVIIQSVQGWAVVYGIKFIGAVLILIFGLWAAKVIKKIVNKILLKKNLDASVISFISNVIYAAVVAFVIIATLSKVGIATASFIAVLGAAGLAIGLAFQGALSNFAAGLLLLLFRPFKTGQFIITAGVAGSVEEIQLLYTQFKTPDNIKVIVPNGKLMSEIITNYSVNETRRAEWKIGVGYNDDLKLVRKVLQEIVEADERILRDPAPQIFVVELGDNSVNFSVRAWTKSSDYWTTFTDTIEVIKEKFDAEGINIPYPQRDVHLFQNEQKN